MSRLQERSAGRADACRLRDVSEPWRVASGKDRGRHRAAISRDRGEASTAERSTGAGDLGDRAGKRKPLGIPQKRKRDGASGRGVRRVGDVAVARAVLRPGAVLRSGGIRRDPFTASDRTEQGLKERSLCPGKTNTAAS